MNRYQVQRGVGAVLLHLFVFGLALWTCSPFLWMVSASLMKAGEASHFPPPLLPESPTTEHYTSLLSRLNLARHFLNSTILATGVSAISLLVNSMAGFAFAKFRFRGKRTIFSLLLATMIVPAQITMLPVFLLLKHLHLLNTYFGIILPGMASAFGIFLVRQYLENVPDSLLEAARMDGASDWRIYWTVVLPLAKPVLGTLTLFTFVGTWNDFLWPLIVMTREEMYTLPVALANLMGEHAPDLELMMAGAVVTVAPVVVLFLALQRYYLRGILVGGLRE